MVRGWVFGAALLFPAAVAAAAPAPAPVRTGDVFEIVRDVETSQEGPNGWGTSTDRDTLTERVVNVGPAGLELEFDLSSDATADDRSRQWRFPARVSKTAGGAPRLLNGDELETRAKAWLQAAGLTEAACGRWLFTWTAIRIECDPQSVLATIEDFDPGADGLVEGALYRDAMAAEPAPLKLKNRSTAGAVLWAELTVDPEAVRRARAETDVAVGEIMRQPLTLEAALSARSPEAISGKIVVTLEIDPAGRVRRRTKVITLSIKGPKGLETQTTTQTLERRLVSSPGA